MKSKRLILVTMLISFGFFSITSFGHHPISSQYSMERKVAISGTLQKLEFSSPHSFLHIKVVGENNNVVMWKVEWASASSLTKLYGINKSNLIAGVNIDVHGLGSNNSEEYLISPNSIQTSSGLNWDRVVCNRMAKEGKQCTVF